LNRPFYFRLFPTILFWGDLKMSAIKPTTLDNSAIADFFFPSRRRVLIGSAGIAAGLPAAMMTAASEQANASTHSTPSKG